MSVVLALLSAMSYGASDFIGGLASRRAPAWSVAVLVQMSCAGSTAVVAPWAGGRPTSGSLLWGAAAGLGSGFGVGFLFRGLARGRMTVVAPLSAVGAALVPVAVGLLSAERPGPWVSVGVVTAFPGIWLVAAGQDEPAAPAAPGSPVDRGILDGALAGLGFGVMFAALGQVPASAGLWPTVVTQVASAAAAAVLAVAFGGLARPGRAAAAAALAGPLSAAASILFLLSAQGGLLTVSAVVASLYPAATILLAVAVLGERVRRRQAVGLVLCGATVVLAGLG